MNFLYNANTFVSSSLYNLKLQPDLDSFFQYLLKLQLNFSCI